MFPDCGQGTSCTEGSFPYTPKHNDTHRGWRDGSGWGGGVDSAVQGEGLVSSTRVPVGLVPVSLVLEWVETLAFDGQPTSLASP